MGCCAVTRFCWHFIVNEGAEKIVERRDRQSGQSKFTKVSYFQFSYNDLERQVQIDHGVGAAHMVYFSRVLREIDDDPDMSMMYSMFTDRRWCSLPAMYLYLSKKRHNVSFTSTPVVLLAVGRMSISILHFICFLNCCLAATKPPQTIVANTAQTMGAKRLRHNVVSPQSNMPTTNACV